AEVGRFCYTVDSSETRRIPDPPAIIEARAGLLATLDTLAQADAADAWIAGQRVRYLIEAQRYDEAVRAGAQCGAAAWWCAALGGLARHAAQQYASADSTFAIALASMSA